MSNNEWYERGELPPVGVECEFKLVGFWKHCEVKGEATNYGERIVLAQIGEGCKATSDAKLFRPIRTDRERAIDAALKIAQEFDLPSGIHQIFEKCYDAGLLRLPESK